MIFQLLIVLAILTIGWGCLYKRERTFPPGPNRLPLLGHLPLLGRNPHKTIMIWKNTYGSIIGVWFGKYRSVVLNDAMLIREALNNNSFSGRPSLNVFDARSEDRIIRGFALTNGSHWREQRRFALKHLRDFRTNIIEANIQEAVHGFMEGLVLNVGKPIQVKHLFNVPVINVFRSIIFGETLSPNDPDSLEAVQGLTAFIDNTSLTGSLAMFVPWIAKIAPKLSGYESMTKGFPIFKTCLEKMIERQNVHYVENQPRHFVDSYQDQVKKTVDPNSSFYAESDFMVHTLADLFLGGTESTSTTLSWFCAYLIHHNHVQVKIQKEIDEVVGSNRVPSLADRHSMPYVEAVLNEVMRFSTILPFGVFRSATQDVEFHGFSIPKHTMIIANIYAVHFDETIWGDPQNFRPERFIDSNGKLKKNENLLPFSTGNRVCIGERLARDELFLFAVSLLQTYHVSPAGPLPSLEPHFGMTLSPKPFEMILKKRIE